MSKVKFNYKNVSSDNVDKLIATAVRSVNSMQKAVQYAAVGVLMHAKKHGDYSKANELVKALGNGVRRKALVEFFVTFGGLVIDAEDANKGFTGWKGKEAISVEAAQEVAWWELKPEQPFKGFDLDKEIEKLVKRAEKAANDEEHADKIDVDAEKLVKLMALVS